MRIIKLGIISLVFFAVLITLISFFFPSNVRISKAIDVNASQDQVMEQLSDPVNWKNWYPSIDSAGTLPVITQVTDSTVIAKSVLPNGKKAVTGWNIYPASIPNSVTVQWYMDFHLGWYPWEKFSSLLLEKRYGPLLEQGLEKLKTYFMP